MIGVEKILTNIAEDTTPQLGGDLDFQKYKAVAMACDNGATLPTSPVIGQWFLHTPTGRSILFQYNGTAWSPIISYGTMTMYVDNTDGTDDQAHGTGVDANAFKTIKYAVDTIPGLVGGNVTININNETYNESLNIGGKKYTGAYGITIQGTLNIHDSLTASGNGVKGTTTAQATFVDNLPLVANHYDNQLLKFTSGDNNGIYRVIDSNTTSTITLTGQSLVSDTATNDTSEVYNWGTTITSVRIFPQQTGITINNIYFNSSGVTIYADFSSNLILNKVKTAGAGMAISLGVNSNISAYYCLITNTIGTSCIYLSGASSLIMNNSKIIGFTGIGIEANINASINLNGGNVIDGITKGAGVTGIQVICNSSVIYWCPNVYNIIRNCGKGIYAYGGGQCLFTSSNNYINNTANETATAASFGYID